MDGLWRWRGTPQLAFTQSADTLLLCHPDMVPQRVTRTSHTAWTVAPWSFVREPFYRFVEATLADAKLNLGRYTELWKQGVISQQQYNTQQSLVGQRHVLLRTLPRQLPHRERYGPSAHH